MRAWLTRHWFIPGLLLAAGLAFLFPALGARGGPLRPELTTKAGVALIFFLQGLTISAASLRSGAMRWRLHVATQLFIFGLFPAFALLLDFVWGGVLPDDLRTGFLFLAVLPTTVSTCVVFTASSRGNVSGALFNSALANTAGVVITPVWATVLLGAQGEAPALLPMVSEIAALLIAPLIIGQLVRRVVRPPAPATAARIGVTSSAIILYMVFTAFADSVATGAFAQAPPGITLLVVVTAAALFIVATGAAFALGRQLGFDAGDRRTMLFCAPQKTLAAGAPMAHILFEGHAAIGLILLPLVIYHIVQLLAGASLTGTLAARHPARAEPA